MSSLNIFLSDCQKVVSELQSRKYYFLVIGALSGFIFLLVFKAFGYNSIDPDTYLDRDDGVITYSHVVNLIEHGFIGVSPSGEMGEGFSNPFTFIIYFIYYLITRSDFYTFNRIIATISTFLIGFVFINFFQRRFALQILYSIISSFIMVFAVRFLQWHAAGLDNPFNEILMLSVIFIIFYIINTQSIKYYYSLIFISAAISRVEYSFYIVPIFMLGVIFMYRTPLLRKYLNLCGISLLGIFLIHFIRYLYFGQWVPNTTIAQGLDMKAQIAGFLSFDKGYYRSSITNILYLVFYNHGLILLFSLPLFFFVKRSKTSLFVLSVIFSVFMLTIFHYLTFRASRLDIVRYGTHLVPISILGMFYAVDNFHKAYQKLLFLILPIYLFIFSIILTFTWQDPDYLCCSAKGFEFSRNWFLKIKSENDLERPLVANPDLGDVSFYKEFNILDLGFIGSPVLSKLVKVPELSREYIMNVMTPDIIEVHSGWLCQYNFLFQDTSFSKKYRAQYTQEDSPECRPAKTGTYFNTLYKKDTNTRERLFYDKFARAIRSNDQSLIKILHDEISGQPSSSNLFNSSYIFNTLYQFNPEIRKKEYSGRVATELSRLKAGRLYNTILDSWKDKKWQTKTVDLLLKSYLMNLFNCNNCKHNLAPTEAASYLHEAFKKDDNFFQVFFNKNVLILYKEDASKIDLKSPFFLHVYPTDTINITPDQRSSGFQN
ncbi:MAG TPA: hypothetical protein VF691_01540, partial [Cytophagaceae bacterium]